MSDSESTSSEELSPRRFRPRSPVSDTESVVSTAWKRQPAALHPSSSQVFDSPSKPVVLGPPRGFGAQSASLAPSRHAPSTASSSHHYHPTQSHSFENVDPPRRSKGKEKERPRQQSKDVPGKGKERDKGTPVQHVSQTVAVHPSQSTFEQGPPDATKKSFRIHAYSNDPSAATIYIPQQGPYGAAYRAESSKAGSSSEAKSRHQRAPPQQSVPDPQPRSSYYRYDYDKVRESAPANRAKQAAATATHHPSAPNHGANPHEAHSYSTPAPTPSSEDRHRSSRSTKRKGTDMYTAHQQYHPPDQYYGDTQVTPPDHFDSATPPPQPQYFPPEVAPAPAPPKERRHKSRPHRHEQPHHPAPAPAPPPAPAQSQPLPYSDSTTRVIRTLTLLIEDRRSGHEDNILAEVKVPFKQISGSDATWADAQEVINELQSGASRIDGAAKLYTMRGKWKQYFFRIAANGEQTCQSANLQVTPERTLEVFIEDNPPPPGMTIPPISSPPRVDRELLTPITDSMASPSPAPMPLHGHKRASKSSLFSIDDQPTPSADRQSFDGGSYMYGVNKRPRSSSIQSMQSVTSDGYMQPSKRDSYSPMDYRAASAKPSTASLSRASSRSSLPPQYHHPEPPQMQMSPMSPSPEPTPEPEPLQRLGSWSFPQSQANPSFSSSSSSSVQPGPSPPKKAKRALPQVHQYTERSVSPDTSQPASYPWSHSRTSSAGSMTGFAAYAGTRKPSGSSQSASNAFAKYDYGVFNLPTPKSEASITPAAHTNIALPTLSTPVAPSTTPYSLPSRAPTPPTQTNEPATIAPGAISVTPTLSGQVSSDLDNAVGRYVRAIIDKKPEWTTFVENRKRVLKAGEQLAQYAYVQSVIDLFTGTATPADLEGAGSVTITKAQVMRAFNLPLSWGDECTETLRLTALYGPKGTRGEDERVVRMLDAPPAITTKTTAKMYLDLLREVDRQRTAGPSHPTTEPPRAKEPQWQLRG